MMNVKNLIKLLIGILILSFLIVSCAPKLLENVEEGAVSKKENINPKLTKIGSIIEMECDKGVVSFKETSLWDQRIEDGKFKEEQIEEFKDSIKGFGVEAKDCFVEFKEYSSTLFCTVHGSFHQSWYDFDWFLRPNGLDFLDSHFKRKEKELSWEGKINEVKTKINIRFPYLISNCHEHVWKR